MSQTAYSMSMGTAVNGALYDSAGNAKTISTYIATEEMKFGRAIAKDTGGDNLCKLPDTSTDQILGVALRDLTEPNGSASTDNTYPDGAAVAIVSKGRIWVEVEETVTPADDVFVRHASGGGGSQLGIFRTDADTATALQITNARFVTSASANGYACLEINNP